MVFAPTIESSGAARPTILRGNKAVGRMREDGILPYD